MAAEPQQLQQQQQQRPASAPPAPKPYEPTPEEKIYLADCAAAIVAGCQTAAEAAKVGNGAEYVQYANGVKAFTDAYIAIKSGGNVSRHQGS